MKSIPIKHTAGRFKDGKQFCMICGYKLCDYSNVLIAPGGTMPTGFKAGHAVFVSGTNPIIFSSQEELYKECNNQ